MTTLSALAPEMSSAQRQAAISALVTTTRRSQEALIRGSSNAFMAEWMESGRYLSGVDASAVAVSSSFRSAQAAGFELTTAATAEHVSLALGRQITPVVVTGSEATAWMVGPASYEARVAALHTYSMIGQGASFQVASEAGGRVAAGRLSQAIQASFRQAGDDWNRNQPKDVRTRGWRKVPSGAACGWCQLVADQIYKEAHTVASHDADRCGVSPVVEGDGWTAGKLSGDRAAQEELRKQPASPEASTLPDGAPPVVTDELTSATT